MTNKFNLSICNTVSIESMFYQDLIHDNVVISGNFSNLAFLSRQYYISNKYKSLGKICKIDNDYFQSMKKKIYGDKSRYVSDKDMMYEEDNRSIAYLVNKYDRKVKYCPKELTTFIKEFIELISTFKTKIPEVCTLNFNRRLTFCLACPKLMKKSNQGLEHLFPFSTVRYFYKAENHINDLFKDIFRCTFDLGLSSISKCNIEVTWIILDN